MVSLRVCGVVVALGLSASVAARAQAPAPKAPAIPDIGPTQGSVCPSNNAADIWVCAKEKAKAQEGYCETYLWNCSDLYGPGN